MLFDRDDQPREAKVLTVSELTGLVKTLIEEGIPSVWVEGEISQLSKPASGHAYLSLKDAGAILPCVIWRSSLAKMRFELKMGQSVIAHGAFSVFPPHGKYQLVIDKVEPKGVGAQELALRQLREKLQKLGYFDLERKRPLPVHPRKLAVVTSPSGAAVRDILEILAERWPALEVLICPARVQGAEASQEIAAALRLVNRLHDVDIIIVGRGGGSADDLAAFNDEAVAKAIFESRIPIVSAVGHEIDVTIADLVADVRALTPTHAAKLVTPDREQLLEQLREQRTYLRDLLEGRLQRAKDDLLSLAQRRPFRAPLERIRGLEQTLDSWRDRLDRAIKVCLTAKQQALQSAGGRLEALSPLNVLQRGYSLTRKASDLSVVRASRETQPGELLVTRLQQGSVVSRVEKIE